MDWNFENWFDWSGSRRRKRLNLLQRKAEQVLPVMHQWEGLNMAEREKLLGWVAEFCDRKNWEGCQGLQLTDTMKLLIAGNAGLLVLGWKAPFFFPAVLSVLVHPTSFMAPQRTSLGSGLHLESRTHLEGQAWHRGPVIISWSDVVEPNRATPHNLVVHEFSHQLDMLNGGNADGMPPIPAERERRWKTVTRHSMAHLKQHCDAGDYSILDCYGCEHPSEFFAVSSEAFFEAPHDLASEFPELFDELMAFYESDPRNWIAPT